MPVSRGPFVIVLILGTIGCAAETCEEVVATGVAVEASADVGEHSGGDLMHGLFTYMADAAFFEDCVSGHRYPVAMEAGYIELERAYLEHRAAPGSPLLVRFHGSIEPRPPMEGDGEIDTMVIDRFEAVYPGEDCSGS